MGSYMELRSPARNARKLPRKFYFIWSFHITLKYFDSTFVSSPVGLWAICLILDGFGSVSKL